MQAAQFVFLHYPAPDVLDVQVFFRSAGMALADFPVWVIVELVHPATGIIARKKWTPKISELVDFCKAKIVKREYDLLWDARSQDRERLRQEEAAVETENKRIAPQRGNVSPRGQRLGDEEGAGNGPLPGPLRLGMPNGPGDGARSSRRHRRCPERKLRI